MSYSLVYCNQSKESDVSNTQRLRELLGLHPQSSTHMFKVKKMCLGFSDYCDKNKAEKVLSKLNAYSSDPAMIQQVNDMFALENPLQWSVLIKQESGNIQTELLRRRKIDLTIGVSEYTKREFISPVLIGSLQIVDEITMMFEYIRTNLQEWEMEKTKTRRYCSKLCELRQVQTWFGENRAHSKGVKFFPFPFSLDMEYHTHRHTDTQTHRQTHRHTYTHTYW
jgi:hypothetical protein